MKHSTTLVCTLFVVATLAACADFQATRPAGDAATGAPTATVATADAKPKLGAFGVDTAGMDTSVKPGADFNRYVNGTWIKATQIPSDMPMWGSFMVLHDESVANVRKILDDAASSKQGAGTNAQKIGDFYAALLDTDAIEKKGFAPAKPDLDAIASATTTNDVARLMARPDLPLQGPIGLDVTLDAKNPNRWVIVVSAAGLGLPDRDYYLERDERFTTIRAAYEAHIAKVLALSHERWKDTRQDTADAKAIVALETKIARLHWGAAKRRDADKTYNRKRVADLPALAPKFPWRLALETAGLGNERDVIVAELDAIPKLAELFAATPVATWKAYMTFHLLRASASVLPKALDAEVFAFGKQLSGQAAQPERWKRAASATNDMLGQAVGEVYVQRHFQPQAKVEIDRLIENMRKAYAMRIEANVWMTAPTKKAALEKLAAFRPKVAYPERWKNYASMQIVAGDAWGNARRARQWRHQDAINRLGKPTDKDEWMATPQTVDAYYNPSFNEIVFPAGILQPPFFDPLADAAVNYGAIGAVIGHELGHGFDDQGAKFDAKGVLRNWWAPSDLAAFKKRGDMLADQFSQYEPLPGLKVNGRLTLGENIGDLAGISVAYQAYQLSLGGKPARTIDGFSGDQRFFLAYAQIWRWIYRDESLRNQVLSDPHSPMMFRVNGIVRNHDAWYGAFGVREGDALYLPPDKRVRIW